MARSKLIVSLTASLTVLLSLLAASIVIVQSLQAQTSDGQTPGEETVCDGLSGGAFGICTAYCEAKDCEFSDSRSCDALRTQFERATDTNCLPHVATVEKATQP